MRLKNGGSASWKNAAGCATALNAAVGGRVSSMRVSSHIIFMDRDEFLDQSARILLDMRLDSPMTITDERHSFRSKWLHSWPHS
jgi:hypothetical protein